MIRYRDGHTVEAALLARTAKSMRVAINGSDDAVEFQQVHGTWVSDDCEPVTIEFDCDSVEHAPAVREEDRICARELAARLLRMLFSGEDCKQEDLHFSHAAAAFAH